MKTSIRAVRAKFFIRVALAAALVALVGIQPAKANTADTVTSGQTDLTAAGTYGGGLPGTTSDVEFTGAYSPAIFTVGPTNTSLSIGTLNDLSSTATITINNASATLDTLTLNGGMNSIAPSTSDLLYVKSGDTLTIATSGTVSGTNALDVVLASSGNFDIAGAATIGSVISGGYNITKTGTGTLTLSGESTYSGTTEVSAGTLLLTTGTTAGIKDSTVTVDSGAIFEFGHESESAAVGGPIAGAGTVSINDNQPSQGTTLNLANTYTGSTVFASSSVLIVGVAAAYDVHGNQTSGALGVNAALVANYGDTVWLDGFNTQVGSIASTTAGAIVLGQASGTSAVLTIGGNDTSTTYNGSITDGGGLLRASEDNTDGAIVANTTGGQLVKIGTGTQTLTGQNAYSGATSIEGGTLQFGTENSLYNGGAGATVNGVAITTTYANADINVQSGAIIGFNVGGTGQFTQADLTTILGNIETAPSTTAGLQAGSFIALDTTNASGPFILSTAITDSTGTDGGAVGLTKLGTGILQLTGANTYTGPTTITEGTVQLSGSGTLGNTSDAVAITNNTGFLDLDGTNQSIGDLTGAGTVLNSNAITTSTLTVGNGDTSATTSSFTGTIKDNGGTGGTVAVVKTGAGTAAFSGNNTYSGGTTISQGVLQAGSASALGTGSVGISGGTLQGTVSAVNLAANLTLASGGVLQENNAGTGTFTLTGSTSAFAITGGTWDLAITGSGNDLVTSTGGVLTSFTISGGTLDLTGDTLTIGQDYTILSGFGTGSGDFTSITGYDTSMYDVTFDDTTTIGVGVLDVTAASAAPEPSTWALLLGGLGLLLGRMRWQALRNKSQIS